MDDNRFELEHDIGDKTRMEMELTDEELNYSMIDKITLLNKLFRREIQEEDQPFAHIE